MGNEHDTRQVATAKPDAAVKPHDEWWGQAEAQVSYLYAQIGNDVDGWAGWVKNLDGPMKPAVHAVMQERFGNAFVGQIDQAIEREQQAPVRPLTHEEITNISMTYGDSIDYSVVRLDFSGGFATAPDDQYARTLGNTIHMPHSERANNGSLYSMKLLYHEIGHVWQYQHAGWQYLPQALLAQLREGGDGEKEGEKGAYQWREFAKAGKSLDHWNREAQAEMGARYNICLHGLRDAVDKHASPDPEYMRDFILAFPFALQLAQGTGAIRETTPGDIAKNIVVGPIGLLTDD